MNASIELLCRYPKSLDDATMKEIDEELYNIELIQGDKFDRNKEYDKLTKGNKKAYEYGPFMLSLHDVMSVNEVDNDHICVRFKNGSMFVFKKSYEEFIAIYQTVLGVLVRNFTEKAKIVDINGK